MALKKLVSTPGSVRYYSGDYRAVDCRNGWAASFWIKLDTSEGGAWPLLEFQLNTSEETIDIDSGQPRIRSGGNTSYGTSFNVTKWNHIIVLRTSPTFLGFYVNGVLNGSDTNDYSARPDPGTLVSNGYLMQNWGGNSDFETASLKIWNRYPPSMEQIFAERFCMLRQRRGYGFSMPFRGSPDLAEFGIQMNGELYPGEAYGGMSFTYPDPEFLIYPKPRIPLVPGIQIAFPISDITPGDWLPITGSGLYPMINESAYDDATYIYSPYDPVNEYCEVRLSGLVDPISSINHTIYYRYRIFPAGNSGIDLTVGLYENTSLIAQYVQSGIGSYFTTGFFTLTSGQADSITNYTDLRLRFTANKP